MLRPVATLLLLLTLSADFVALPVMPLQTSKGLCANGCSGGCCCTGANASHSCAVAMTAITGMQYANCATEQAATLTTSVQSDRLLARAAMLPSVCAAPCFFAAAQTDLFEQFSPCPPDPPPRVLAAVFRT